jgi:uncharacterized protein (DUF169 family)
MFGTQEAAKNMIAKRPTIEMGSVTATLVSTLSKAKTDPDAVVVTGMPEQIHWLMPVAATYNLGGRKCAETASFQATYVDANIFPYLTGNMNLSLGCYGCRKVTAIAHGEMLFGIPEAKLEPIVAHLRSWAPGRFRDAARSGEQIQSPGSQRQRGRDSDEQPRDSIPALWGMITSDSPLAISCQFMICFPQ